MSTIWHVEEPHEERAPAELAPAEPVALSARELEVLQMAAEGLTNAGMARRLRLSVHGVKFHLSSIYRKLGVSNRTEAVARLLTGTVPLEESD